MRNVLAVVVGYVAMALGVMAGLSLAYLALGSDRAFRVGSYDVTILWAFISLVVGFGAALLGGWVARRIGRSLTAPRALAAAVVILGFVLAMPVLFGTAPEPPGPRTGAVDNWEAMRQARTPLWIMLINPIVGALGVLVGGRALGPGDGRPTGALPES